MKDIKEFSDSELKKEIERREKEREESLVPKLVSNPYYNELFSTCQQYINELKTNHCVSADQEHYIFEEAMKAFFGEDVFAWINMNNYR